MGVQVPSPAPLKNLVELWFKLLININSRNRIDFLLYKKDDFERKLTKFIEIIENNT